MMGKTHFMMGAYEEAARELEAALALASDDQDVAYTLGGVISSSAKLPKHEAFTNAWSRNYETDRSSGAYRSRVS